MLDSLDLPPKNKLLTAFQFGVLHEFNDQAILKNTSF
jgi:hypothetical protein